MRVSYKIRLSFKVSKMKYTGVHASNCCTAILSCYKAHVSCLPFYKCRLKLCIHTDICTTCGSDRKIKETFRIIVRVKFCLFVLLIMKGQ